VRVVRNNGKLVAIVPGRGWEFDPMKPIAAPVHPLGLGIKTPKIDLNNAGELLHLEPPVRALVWNEADSGDYPMSEVFVLLEGKSVAVFSDRQGDEKYEVKLDSGDKAIVFEGHRFVIR
jgi:hypothetical protein